MKRAFLGHRHPLFKYFVSIFVLELDVLLVIMQYFDDLITLVVSLKTNSASEHFGQYCICCVAECIC